MKRSLVKASFLISLYKVLKERRYGKIKMLKKTLPLLTDFGFYSGWSASLKQILMIENVSNIFVCKNIFASKNFKLTYE